MKPVRLKIENIIGCDDHPGKYQSRSGKGGLGGRAECNLSSRQDQQNIIQKIRQENETLKEEIDQQRKLLHEWMESSSVNLNEKRVALLRGKIFQLEKQVLLLSENLDCRQAMQMQAENWLTAISALCSSLLGKEYAGSLTVERADIEKIHSTLVTCCRTLNQSIERNQADRYVHKLIYSGKFGTDSCTLLDICAANDNVICTNYLKEFEGKLFALHGHLLLIIEALTTSSSHCSAVESHGHLQPLLSNLQITLEDICKDLLQLNHLTPSSCQKAVLPTLKPFTLEDILHLLPTFPKGKISDAKAKLSGLLEAFQSVQDVNQAKIDALQAELNTLRNRQIGNRSATPAKNTPSLPNISSASFPSMDNGKFCVSNGTRPLQDFLAKANDTDSVKITRTKFCETDIKPLWDNNVYIDPLIIEKQNKVEALEKEKSRKKAPSCLSERAAWNDCVDIHQDNDYF